MPDFVDFPREPLLIGKSGWGWDWGDSGVRAGGGVEGRTVKGM